MTRRVIVSLNSPGGQGQLYTYFTKMCRSPPHQKFRHYIPKIINIICSLIYNKILALGGYIRFGKIKA